MKTQINSIQDFPTQDQLPLIGIVIFMSTIAYIYFGIFQNIKERGFKTMDVFMSLVAIAFLLLSISLLFNLNWI